MTVLEKIKAFFSQGKPASKAKQSEPPTRTIPKKTGKTTAKKAGKAARKPGKTAKKTGKTTRKK